MPSKLIITCKKNKVTFSKSNALKRKNKRKIKAKSKQKKPPIG